MRDGPSRRTLPAKEVLEFLRLVWALDHALQQRSKRMRRSLGLTGPQRFVIRMVGWFPSVSSAELSRLLHLHPSTLTGIVKRLELRGYLRRVSDPGDRRRILLHLTARGRAANVSTKGTVEEAMRHTLGKLPDRTVESAREVLQKLVDELE